VTPTRLDHADFWILEMSNDLPNELWFGNEVGIEDCHEFAFGDVETFFERTSFVTNAVCPVQIHCIDAPFTQALDVRSDERLSFVGRIIEDLKLELVAWVIHPSRRFEQSCCDRRFVEERQLNGHPWQVFVSYVRHFLGKVDLAPMLHAQKHQMQPVNAIGTQGEENGEVQDAEQRVEHRLRLPRAHVWTVNADEVAEGDEHSCHGLVKRCIRLSDLVRTRQRVRDEGAWVMTITTRHDIT
jgi:hypothetical protein